MMETLRLGMMVTLVTVVLAAAALLQPDLAGDFGLRQWNLASLDECLRSEERLGNEMCRREKEVQQRLAARERVIRDLIEERLSLGQALAAFRQINEQSGYAAGPDRVLFAGATEEERLLAQIKQWVRAEGPYHAAGKAEAVLRRLEEETSGYGTGREDSMTKDVESPSF